MMVRALLFILLGYLSGSVLYAKIWGKLLCGTDITKGSIDGNPGTANAFIQGGFWCGVLTLFCELLKGILPVYFYMRGMEPQALSDGWMALGHCGSGIGTYLSFVSEASRWKGDRGFLWLPPGVISLPDAGTGVCFCFCFLFSGGLCGAAFLPDNCGISCNASRIICD